MVGLSKVTSSGGIDVKSTHRYAADLPSIEITRFRESIRLFPVLIPTRALRDYRPSFVVVCIRTFAGLELGYSTQPTMQGSDMNMVDILNARVRGFPI